MVYLNFFENPDYASVFASSLEVDNIVMLLSALIPGGAVFEAGKTVLILDEIQDCPEARTALKFFRTEPGMPKAQKRFCAIPKNIMLPTQSSWGIIILESPVR